MLGVPSTGDPSIATVFALLDVIANPEKARAALDELLAATAASEAAAKAAQSATEAAHAAEEVAGTRINEAEAAIAKAHALEKEIDDTIKMVQRREENLKADVAEHESKQQAILDNLAAREVAMVNLENSRQAQFVSAEAVLVEREASLAVREKKCAAATAAAEELQRTYERKLRALQTMVRET